MENSQDLRLAVLIDADNVPHTRIKVMLEEIAKYGTPTFKRIYADWTKPTVSGWKAVLLPHAITPIQQYSYTSGKNSSDSALIIDAMDILYSGRVDGFCIVSSDSDFTRLATRLREAGMRVFGIGEKKTPAPFIAACDKFIYIEILDTGTEEKKQKETTVAPKTAVTSPVAKINPLLTRLITDSISDLADDDGWVFLGILGTLLMKKQPEFDSRNYGFSKLSLLIKSMDSFETQQRSTGTGNDKQLYVRVKNAP